MEMIIMSYVEPLSPRKKRYELTEDILKGLMMNLLNMLHCNTILMVVKSTNPMKYWALKTNLMLVYNIYNDLIYATVFIESNELQYF